MKNNKFTKFSEADRRAFPALYVSDKATRNRSYPNYKYTWKWNLHLMIYIIREKNNFINKKHYDNY